MGPLTRTTSSEQGMEYCRDSNPEQSRAYAFWGRIALAANHDFLFQISYCSVPHEVSLTFYYRRLYRMCGPTSSVLCKHDSTSPKQTKLTRNEQPRWRVREQQGSGTIGALDIVAVRGEVDLRDKALVCRYCAELGESVPRGVDVNFAVVGRDGQAGSIRRVVHVADPVIGILNA